MFNAKSRVASGLMARSQQLCISSRVREVFNLKGVQAVMSQLGFRGSCCVCAVHCVCGITLQTWARHSVREQSVEHRAGAQCDLSSEAGSACRLG